LVAFAGSRDGRREPREVVDAVRQRLDAIADGPGRRLAPDVDRR